MMTGPRLVVQVEDAKIAGFRLNRDRLNSWTTLRATMPAAFRVNTSRLDDPTVRIGPNQTPLVWLDILPYAVSVTARRGARESLTLEPDPGTLTARLRNLPRLPLRVGTRIELVGPPAPWQQTPADMDYTRGQPTWWTGRITNIEEQWDRDDGTRWLTIEAGDVRSQMTATLQGIPTSTDAQTRMDHLADKLGMSVAFYPEVADRYYYTQLPATDLDTSIVEHLTTAAVSARLHWRVTDTFSPQFPGILLMDATSRPDTYFTGETKPFTDRPSDTVPSYYAITTSAGSRQVTSTVELSNRLTSGETRTRVSDPTAVAALGDRTAGVNVTAAPTDLQTIGEWLITPVSSAAPLVTALTVDARHLTIQAADGPQAIDYLDPIVVHRLGIRHRLTIVSLTHVLEPDPDAPAGVQHRVTLATTRRTP